MARVRPDCVYSSVRRRWSGAPARPEGSRRLAGTRIFRELQQENPGAVCIEVFIRVVFTPARDAGERPLLAELVLRNRGDAADCAVGAQRAAAVELVGREGIRVAARSWDHAA